MRTIHIKNEADLIPLPGRSVSAWESGVVRVEEKYVGLTSMEAAHRPLFLVGNPPPSGDMSPSFDGLFISSLPNEVRREDGFTEYNVTMHGRVDNTGTGDPTSPEALASQASLILNTAEIAGIKYSAFTPRIVTSVVNKNVGRALEIPKNWDFAVQPFDPDDLNTRFVIRKYNGGEMRYRTSSWILQRFESGVTTTVLWAKARVREEANFFEYSSVVLSMRPETDFSKNGAVDELTVNWYLQELNLLSAVNFPIANVYDINGNLVDNHDRIFPPA
jgi:hypothetical protein